MESNILENKQCVPVDIETVSAMIKNTQLPSGEIPWCGGKKTDPWDHVEAAMGLSIGGHLEDARRAYEWMARMQLDDGSWYASYRDGIPDDKTRDSNLSSYIAVGVFHYYLISEDISFLESMWETVRAATAFALGLQTPAGEICWAISPEGNVDPMALLTGSCSVFMSLKCALSIANRLGYEMPAWNRSLQKLNIAIKDRPWLFNMTKARFSMDWFYPVLCGVLTGERARRRIKRYWEKFVITGQGVRCVSDRPWVTVAETCELSLALSAMGDHNLSKTVFNWILDKTNEDGSYWCGFTCPDMTIWPEDKTTWTNAVVLIAADAICNLTPASKLFNHRFWNPE